MSSKIQPVRKWMTLSLVVLSSCFVGLRGASVESSGEPWEGMMSLMIWGDASRVQTKADYKLGEIVSMDKELYLWMGEGKVKAVTVPTNERSAYIERPKMEEIVFLKDAIVPQDEATPPPIAARVKVNSSVKTPFIILIPEADRFLGLYLDDSTGAFPWNSIRFVNASGVDVDILYRNELATIPSGGTIILPYESPPPRTQKIIFRWKAGEDETEQFLVRHLRLFNDSRTTVLLSMGHNHMLQVRSLVDEKQFLPRLLSRDELR